MNPLLLGAMIIAYKQHLKAVEDVEDVVLISVHRGHCGATSSSLPHCGDMEKTTTDLELF